MQESRTIRLKRSKSSKLPSILKIKKSLSISKLFQVQLLFKKNSWPINSTNINSRFNKFCHCLSLLKEKEQDFLIKLSETFKAININNFVKYLENSFLQIPQTRIDEADKIFIFPLTTYIHQRPNGTLKRTAGKTKSAESLFYFLDAQKSTIFENEKIIFIKNSLNKAFEVFDFSKDLLILIDDFSGTGETAIDICKNFLSFKFLNGSSLNSDNIIIITIAAQEEAIKAIKKDVGIDLHTGITGKKGISQQFPDIQNKKRLMKIMEKRIGCRNDFLVNYSLGYKESEALFSFLKSPNNTFPIYWATTNRITDPIFPRYSKRSI